MSLSELKTIAAIATPLGYGGIGIIRLSGSEALAFTQRLLGDRQNAFTPNLATLSVIVVCIWQMVGFCTVVYLAALQGVPQDLKDAANVDGANPWQTFYNVTLPLLSPGVTVNVVIILIMMFKLYDIIQVMTATGPAGSTESLAYYVTRMAFTVNKVGYASAMAVVLFIIIAMISAGLGKFLRSREVEY